MSISNKLINRAIDYILNNLYMEISVDDVANHCNISKYHFNRLFKAETGESIYSFIKRLKMERSAIHLGSETKRSATDIGLDFGYSSSNYSSAFKKHHKRSPAEYRKHKEKNREDREHPFYNIDINYGDFEYYNSRIEIREFDDFRVLFKRYIGSYKEMKVHWQDFLDTYGRDADKDTKFIEISYDDPKITDVNRCIYDICMTVSRDIAGENTKIIRGGKYLIYNFQGRIEEIFQAYKGIFNIWFPQSGLKLDDRVGFDLYKFADCNRDCFEMDICIPIK